MAEDDIKKRGRMATAGFIREQCVNGHASRVLADMLNDLLDPRKPIPDKEGLDWCRWLVASGQTPEEFASTVRLYDNATTCGLVWTAHFVAYRCRTCGISPCMSLCASCFQQGNHEGHDFNMFRSQAGGACDCGDTSVMKESGFCHKHGPKAQKDKPLAPRDLLRVAEIVLPRLMLRLVQHFRDNSQPPIGQDPANDAIQTASNFLGVLHEFSQLGAAMRHVITDALINPQIYKTLINAKSEANELQLYINNSSLKYAEALQFLQMPTMSNESHYLSVQNNLVHQTFLDELVFWTVMFEFPQELVCFLLNMLPDDTYKEAFTRAFVRHYSRIAVMLVKSKDHDKLSSRVVHVSVQLFSNAVLSLRMTEELHLLHVMVISLKDMMRQILIPSVLHVPEKNRHYSVDCINEVMKDHRYWSLLSDLNNVLSHKPIVFKFLSDNSLLEMWFKFLSKFQGMNSNRRELHQHVKFEPNTYYAAFSAELEASASIMWALIAHLKDSDTLTLTHQVLSYCITTLQEWFDALGFPNTDMDDQMQVSFHLPLHRYLAVFINQAVQHQHEQLENILPSTDFLKYLMIHPLKAQVAFCEILCGMWVRNGLQMKGQAMTYIQCHFCNSMVDADIFLLQLCATHVDPDWFITTVLERFHMLKWLSFDTNQNAIAMEPEHETAMLEGMLTFLATLFSVRTNIGLSDVELTKMEMVTLLCMGDKTHSQLMDLMPEKCGSVAPNKNFETMLARVSDYKAPNFAAGGNMLQGMYVPKDDVWEYDYDPIYVLLRAVHRRDFQASLDRFSQFVQLSEKFKSSGSPWPPFRMPGPVHSGYVDPRKLLQCKTMHGLLFSILYKAVNEPTVSEFATSLCIYLLDMAVSFSGSESLSGKELLHFSGNVEDEVPDLQFKEWFSSSFIHTNLQQTISKVVLTNENSETNSMEVDSYSEFDMDDVGLSSGLDSPIYDIASEAGTPEDQSALPITHIPLSLTAPTTSQALVPVSGSNMMVVEADPQAVVLRPPTSTQLVAVPNPLLYLPTASAGSMQPHSTQGSMALPPSRNMAAHSSLPKRYAMFLRRMNAAVQQSIGMVPTSPLPSSLPMLLSGHHSTTDQEKVPSSMKALPASQTNYVDVNESILSLLLKLHSKLSGNSNAYSPHMRSTNTFQHGNESRIGSGPHFIGIALDKICQMSNQNCKIVQDIRNKLWPQQSMDTSQGENSFPKNFPDKDDRRRKARERQQKLIAEFASQQKAFMEQSKDVECGEDERLNVSDFESMEKPLSSYSAQYDCAICGQTSPSTDDKPVGLVCLLQASSVLGSSSNNVKRIALPLSDEEIKVLGVNQQRASFMSKRSDELGHNFDDVSRLMSVNIGWEGGIHVRTCGHYLHLDCQTSYLQTLRHPHNRQPSLQVEKGEYWCPLCRQLANTVLPVTPNIDEITAMVKSRSNNQRVLALELLNLINSDPPTPQKSNLMKAMSCIMEDMTNATYHQYKSCSLSQRVEVFFLFISSVARTNLELEIVFRGGNVCNEPINPSFRPCFVPLLHVLATHSKILPVKPHKQLWPTITGLQSEDNLSSISRCEKEIPLLLKDICAVLLQFVLTLPIHIDKDYFTCMVRMLYNVVYTQAVAILTCKLSEEQRMQWKILGKLESSLTSLVSMLSEVIDNLEHCALYLQDEDMDRPLPLKNCSLSEMEKEIRQMCIPFMRISALLQHHIYKESLPIAQETDEEFKLLCSYLELGDCEHTLINGEVQNDCALCLTWIIDEPRVLVQNWCQEFIAFVNIAQIASRNLLAQHQTWSQPRLLQLPQNYDQIFQHYHQKKCSRCGGVPKEPSLCLVCGALVCLRENCCRQLAVGETVQHSIDCGAGTAMFLAVNSSTIIVIRGKRACLWGSVYLDSFGEEDRDLKRGKPLYLIKERYHLLEQQWLTHTFDNTNKRWIFHKDSL